MAEGWFAQEGFDIRLEWGRAGARRAAERGDILVVVDVLSFTSSVVTAVAHGAVIYPCATQAEAVAYAASVEAEVAVHRSEVPTKGRFSLSPVTFLGATPGDRICVASPNGATCSRLAPSVPALFAASLLNASAVAEQVAVAMTAHQCPVTVLACGERWTEQNEDGELRFALEDYLGAGAVIAALPPRYHRSPEAFAAQATFSAMRENLPLYLQDCGSGRELHGKGFGADVTHAAQHDLYTVAPRLHPDGFFHDTSYSPT